MDPLEKESHSQRAARLHVVHRLVRASDPGKTLLNYAPAVPN